MQVTLVGRGNDLRRALSLLDSKGAVLFMGPSGIGKTALCDVIAEDWRSKGGTVVEVRGTEGLQGVPFGALTLSLHVGLGDTDAVTLAKVTSALTGGDSPAMVVVDDTHLLDPESAAVVSGLAQVTDISLVMAITSGESVSSDITSVWARWPDSRIDVEPLGRDDVARLLANLVGGPLEEETLNEISTLTLGYPLYVTAIAAELADRVSGAPPDSTIAVELSTSSDRLTSLMERRLGRLNREERHLFDVVAFGESTPVNLLPTDDPSILEALDRARLVRLTGGRAQVAHPLLGSVARETLTNEGRRWCATQLLEGLGPNTDPGDVAAVVRKALGVGVTPEVRYLRIAAEVALGWGDYAGVARITSVVPGDPELKTLRARAARFLGETPDTEIPQNLDDASLTEYLSGTSQALAYTERRFSDAIDFLKEGMAGVVEPENRNRLALELMILSGLVGDLDALLGAARVASGNPDPYTRLLALSGTQFAEALTLATASSEETYRAGRELVDSGEAGGMLYEQLEMSHVMVDLAEGQFNAAQMDIARFEEKTLHGSWLTIQAVLADAWLPLPEAAALADSAVAALEEFDPLANLAQARYVAELRRAQMGETPEVEEDSTSHEQGVVEIDRLMSQRADAWLAWSDSDPTAGKRLVELGRDAVRMGHRFWGLSAFVDATRLGNGSDVLADVEHLVITRGAGLALLGSHYARAESSGEFWAAARMWWEAGAPVYAIEAAIRGSEADDKLVQLGVHLMAAQGVAPVVGKISAVANPLSERQTEIIGPVLAGGTNDEVAEELFLSRRTVENHLHRVYQTLSLTDGRESLIAELGWLACGENE